MEQNYCFYCMNVKQAEPCSYCGKAGLYEAPVHHLRPGTVLRDKYLIGKALGEGGFGITYIGRDLTLDMRIAIKEYFPKGCSNRNHNFTNEVTLTQGSRFDDYEENMRRFLSEARSLARFSEEPGIVGVRDFFQENGTAYIVMEYLDGITLRNYITQNGPIPVETLLQMMDPILQALSGIHRQGLIHRDISPDNIMMLKNGRLKLLDFGNARDVAGDKTLTIVLKRGYAPEEQYRARGEQGPWTDVYALCATLYHCITGKVPAESIERLLGGELKTPSQLGIQIPENIENALMQGMTIKHQDRIQTIDALRSALLDQSFGITGPIYIHWDDIQGNSPVTEHMEEATAGASPQSPVVKRHPGKLLLLALCGCILIVLGILLGKQFSTKAPDANDEESIHRYTFHQEDCTWSEAYQSAIDKGGYLVRINTQEEWDYLIQEIEAMGYGDKYFFIGGRRENDGTTYHWVDTQNRLLEEALNQDSFWGNHLWLPGEPSIAYGGKEELYMEMNQDPEHGWGFNDVKDRMLSYNPSLIAYIVEYVD